MPLYNPSSSNVSSVYPLLATQLPYFVNATNNYLATGSSVGSPSPMSANTLYQGVIVVTATRTFTSVALSLTTLNGTSAIRVGIYNIDATGQPTTLIVDAGTVDSSTGTGALGNAIKTISNSIAPGVYSLCCVSNGTPAIQMHSDNGPGVKMAPVLAGGTWFGQRGLTRSFTYAALPADETAQVYTPFGSNFPYLGIR